MTIFMGRIKDSAHRWLAKLRGLRGRRQQSATGDGEESKRAGEQKQQGRGLRGDDGWDEFDVVEEEVAIASGRVLEVKGDGVGAASCPHEGCGEELVGGGG